jgi:hypothetical protein
MKMFSKCQESGKWDEIKNEYVRRREADHSPQSSAEVKEWVELYLHSPNTPPWCDG